MTPTALRILTPECAGRSLVGPTLTDVRPRRPPLTDLERLAVFMEVTNEHLTLSAVFPIDRTVPAQGLPQPSGDRWNRLVRAFALRKFFLSQNDDMYCVTFYDSLLSALGDNRKDDDLTHEQYADSVADVVPVKIKLPDGGIPAQQIVEDVLYGYFLHGDIDRLRQAKKFRSPFGNESDILLHIWTNKAEKHLEWLCGQVLRAETQRRLELPWPI